MEIDLRDYFAAQAMSGLLAGRQSGTAIDADAVAGLAYAIADAMIAEQAVEHDTADS